MVGAKFWESIVTSTAQKWVELLFSPALLFWAGGLLAYVTTRGWKSGALWLGELDQFMQIALVLGALAVVLWSADAVQDVQQSVLRALEGYWPRFLAPLRSYLVKRTARKVDAMRNSWDELAVRYERLNAAELETYASLDATLGAYPSEKRLLPTCLGNRLRAAEDYAWRRYGLAIGVLWPRLWLVMPERAQNEIISARGRLDTAVRLVVWSLLFVIWSAWAWWWVLPLAAVGAIWGYLQALQAAGVYGELLRTAFDLYRFALYESLRWPLPTTPAEEQRMGQELTSYLWRGSYAESLTFKSTGSASKANT
jgi:hypothetical protein